MNNIPSRFNPFTNEELTAFLDGENEFAPMKEIANALKTDRDLANRLERLSLNKDVIVKAFRTIKPTMISIPRQF